MANAIQKRLDELGWTRRQYDVMSRQEFEEIMEKFHYVSIDSTIQYEEADVSDKSMDETKSVFLELNLGGG